MSALPMHPLAEIFPLMEGAAFDELIADIKEHGVREAITLFGGKVLDGRNRYRACAVLGIVAPTTTFEGDDPLAYVVSRNLRRRHLKDSQRALIAARIANLPRGAGRRDRRAGEVSQTEAAQLLNVRVRTLAWGRQVDAHAIPEIREMVERGTLSVSAAGKVSHLPKKDQAALFDEGSGAIVSAARKYSGLRGRHNRSEFSILWRQVDEICEALAATRLDNAHIAARGLIQEIDRIVAGRRAQ